MCFLLSTSDKKIVRFIYWLLYSSNMEKLYLDEPEKILDVLGSGGRLIETGDEKSEVSYRGRRVVIPTAGLKRAIFGLSPKYTERTIGSLTGLGIANIGDYKSRKKPNKYSAKRDASMFH